MGDQRTRITGITWGHTRGLTPWLAAAQVWQDRHPDVAVEWHVRSLWAFGEGAIDDLFDTYDMVVIDHPFMGEAVRRGYLLPLESLLDEGTLAELAATSVGRSFDTYRREGRSWGLATDAACLTAAWRPDLLERLGEPVPTTLDEVVSLARRTGAVALPLAPIDVLSVFFTLAANAGARPCHEPEAVVPRVVGKTVWEEMRRLVRHVPSSAFEANPIRLLGQMASGDDIAYCPYTYSYSNYSRPGYHPRLLTFGDVPVGPGGHTGGACLGGAGVVISSRTAHPELVAEFAGWAAGAECQRTTYALAGGQPGHVAAWEDDLVNAVSGDFFRRTRSTMDRAFHRPTHDGFASFQHDAATLLHDALQRDHDPDEVLDQLDGLHRRHWTG